MKRIIAALDNSAAARPVLETALGLGALAGLPVDAVSVGGEPARSSTTALVARQGLGLRVLADPVEEALLEAASAEDVAALVIGARGTPGGRRPAGHVALRVMAESGKPVVVVPPDSVGACPRQFKRVLVPLEGSEESSKPVFDLLSTLVPPDVELVVLHVFTTATTPRFFDRPEHDLDLLGDEFLGRHAPWPGARIEWRTGSAGGQVADACGDAEADLVVLAWSQDISVGHAAVVREVVTRSRIPVLLLPLPAS